VVYIPDVVTYTNFGDHRLRGFWVAGVKFPPLPLTFVVALTTLSHYRASVWCLEWRWAGGARQAWKALECSRRFQNSWDNFRSFEKAEKPIYTVVCVGGVYVCVWETVWELLKSCVTVWNVRVNAKRVDSLIIHARPHVTMFFLPWELHHHKWEESLLQHHLEN